MPDPSTELQGARILSVAEDELSRIILDIHDGPVQYLFTALTLLTALQNELSPPEPCAGVQEAGVTEARVMEAGAAATEAAATGATATDAAATGPTATGPSTTGDSAKLRAELAQIGMLLESSLYEIRFFLGAFRPPEFRRRSLASIVEGLVIQHEEWTHTTVHLTTASLPADTPLAVKMAIYRVLQEALTNGYRHAGVEEQWVRMWGEDGWIRLEVIDQGRGFTPPDLEDPAEAERADHIGLRGMHDRVRLLGGEYHLESAPGAGTRVRVAVPSAA